MYRLWYILGLRGDTAKEQTPEIPVRFYRTEAGRAPVLDWVRSLDKADRNAIGLDLMRVQFGWPIGRPLVGSLFGRCARRFQASESRGSSCASTRRRSSCCMGSSRKHRKRPRMTCPWRNRE